MRSPAVNLLRTRAPVHLDATLRGGQSFRWTTQGSTLQGVARGHRFHLEPHPEGVRWQAEPRDGAEAVLRSYLDVDSGYMDALERLARDPLLEDAVARYGGLRLLHQDPWEATACFVLSSNNNVRRLEGLVHDLATALGEAQPGGWHAFPGPEAVVEAGESTLRELGCGYRAPYLLGTATQVADGEVDLRALAGAPVGEARQVLRTLPGVGPKVADCILLYALDHRSVFPVDRWTARWLREVGCVDVDPGDPRDVRAFARDRWGMDAGLAQQFAFHASRLEGVPGQPGQPARALGEDA